LDVLTDTLSPGSTAGRIRLKIALGIDADEKLNHIVSHFPEFDSALINYFGCDMRSMILSRCLLAVSSRDSLFKLISTCFANRGKFFRLFDFPVLPCIALD
jgi:hypothetical protein